MPCWEPTPKDEGLAEVVRAFLAKYDEVAPHINSAFAFMANHGCFYGGPNIADELAALRQAVGWDEAAEGRR